MRDGKIAASAAEGGAIFKIIGMSIICRNLRRNFLLSGNILTITVCAWRKTQYKNDNGKKGKCSSHKAKGKVLGSAAGYQNEEFLRRALS